MKNSFNIIQKSISLFFLLLVSLLSYAQQQGTSFILNQAVTATETKDWVATDFINMINNNPSPDGFHAKPDPDPDIYVRASINPFYIEPPCRLPQISDHSKLEFIN